MKVLMVLTSHDQLGNTGRKTGFWLEELAAPYYVFKDAGARSPRIAQGRPPAARSQEQRGELPDRHHPTVREGYRRRSPARQDLAPRWRQAGGLRHGLLPWWSWADVGSRRRQELDQAAGILPGRRQDLRGGLPLLRRAPPRQAPNGKLFVEGKTVTGFTNGEEEDVGLTKVVPFLVEDELISLGATFQGQELGRSHGRRRPTDHRAKSGLVGPCCQASDRYTEQEGKIVRPQSSRRRGWARLRRSNSSSDEDGCRSSDDEIGHPSRLRQRRRFSAWAITCVSARQCWTWMARYRTG